VYELPEERESPDFLGRGPRVGCLQALSVKWNYRRRFRRPSKRKELLSISLTVDGSGTTTASAEEMRTNMSL